MLGRSSTPEDLEYLEILDAQRTTATEELSRMIATRLDGIVRDYAQRLGNLRERPGAERARREIAGATGR